MEENNEKGFNLNNLSFPDSLFPTIDNDKEILLKESTSHFRLAIVMQVHILALPMQE